MKKMTADELEECVSRLWQRNVAPGLIRALEEHIAALEADVAQAKDAALEEASARVLNRCCSAMRDVGHCEHRRCDCYQNVLTEIRSLKCTPAQEVHAEAGPCCWASTQPGGEHAGGCIATRPPAEMASEENGLLPKKRRREHEYGEDGRGQWGTWVAYCVRPGCKAHRMKDRNRKNTCFYQDRHAPPKDEPGPCEGKTT